MDNVCDFFKETMRIFVKGRGNNAVELKVGNYGDEDKVNNASFDEMKIDGIAKS